MANEMTSAPEMTEHEMTPAPLQYRSVGVRFVALLIDVIIASIIASVFASPLQTPVFNSADFTNGTFHVSTTANSLAGLGSIISSLVVLIYFTLLLGAYGQTVGMKALKIKVVKEDGSKIGYVDALVRSLLLIIDAIPVSYTHLRAHETGRNLVCRLLLEKKKKKNNANNKKK